MNAQPSTPAPSGSQSDDSTAATTGTGASNAGDGNGNGNGKRKHSNRLLYAIIIGAVSGVFAGLYVPGIAAVQIVGDVFLHMLFMMVIPLIVASMICGIASLGDVRKIGRIGFVTILFYLTTTVVAVVLGIALSMIFQPGGGSDMAFLTPTENNPATITLNPGEEKRFYLTLPSETDRYELSIAPDTPLTIGATRPADDHQVSVADGQLAFVTTPTFDASGRYLVTVKNPGAETITSRVGRRFEGDGRPSLRALPRTISVPGNSSVGFAINVPKRPKAMTIELTGANDNVRVYARAGKPLETAEHAQVKSRGAQTQRIHLDAETTPRLRDGTWYLLVENKNPHSMPMGIDLTLEVPEGAQSFVQPDMTVWQRIWAFTKDFVERMFPKNLLQAGVEMNILPLIVFALVFGAVLTTLGAKGAPVISLAEGVFEAIMKMVMLIMYFAPVGIFALVAARVGSTDDLIGELTKLAAYVGVVLAGLAIHAIIVLPVLLFTLTGRSPLRYAIGMGKALLTAFSTASSNATMPLTIECLIDENKVSKKSTEFVVPLGATINMDGTALYEAVAVIFMAQLLGVPLDMTAYIIIAITATLAAIGAAGIPEAGTVTMVMVLLAVGLPAEAVGYILAIDWFLDRCRTSVNVWGDSVAAAVTDVHALGANRGDPATAV